MNAAFVLTKQENASIMIDSNSISFPYSSNNITHLPPLHRLKQDHVILECLKKGHNHKIAILDKTYNEQIIIYLDGIEVSSLWDFLNAKTLMIKMIQQSELNITHLQWIQKMFHYYNIGTTFDFIDIINLLELKNNDTTGKPSPYIDEIAMKMFEEIFSRWFKDICINENCVTTTKRVCCNCSQKICSNLCEDKHKVNCITKK